MQSHPRIRRIWRWSGSLICLLTLVSWAVSLQWWISCAWDGHRIAGETGTSGVVRRSLALAPGEFAFSAMDSDEPYAPGPMSLSITTNSAETRREWAFGMKLPACDFP